MIKTLPAIKVWDHLVHLLPALEVLGPDHGVVMEQRLGDGGVRADCGAALVQRGQAPAVIGQSETVFWLAEAHLSR